MAAVSSLGEWFGSPGLRAGRRWPFSYPCPLPVIHAPGRPEGTGAYCLVYPFSPQSPPVTICTSPGACGAAHSARPKPHPRRLEHVTTRGPPLALTCSRRACGPSGRVSPCPRLRPVARCRPNGLSAGDHRCPALGAAALTAAGHPHEAGREAACSRSARARAEPIGRAGLGFPEQVPLPGRWAARPRWRPGPESPGCQAPGSSVRACGTGY